MTEALSGVFVAGTDTGAGKTYVTAAIAAALVAEGRDVVVSKPLLTGLDEDPGVGTIRDNEILAAAVGGSVSPTAISPLRFGPPLSPHLAAELAGVEIDERQVIEDLRRRASSSPGSTLVVEGVGGLLVPLTRSFAVADLATELGLPMVIAARPGLGTINHSLLSLEAARSRGLNVAAVIFGPWPESPSDLELDNLKTVAELGNVHVSTLPFVEGLTHAAFAQAGAGLEIDRLLTD